MTKILESASNRGPNRARTPEGLIRQPYTYPEPSGGFLYVQAGQQLTIQFHNAEGDLLYTVNR